MSNGVPTVSDAQPRFTSAAPEPPGPWLAIGAMQRWRLVAVLTLLLILSFLDRTGALLLGAAGLLRGYRAATHWSAMDQLDLFGAIATHERVVVDRNRMTGGGVTAGIDFGIRLAAKIAGEDYARRVELGLEYAPEPPFGCGTPALAPADLVEAVRTRAAARNADRRAASERAAKRLR